MGTDRFFDETSEQSAVKVAIVSKYFHAWARVMIPIVRSRGRKIAYIDLFSGPGCYKDGTKSTPILILEQAIGDPIMSQMLVSIFNDRDPHSYESLKTCINQMSGIDKLKYKPKLMNRDIDEETIRKIEDNRLVPSLFFIDPWGYKGLSIRLIKSVLKDWGSDCIFFFNYNRIKMGLRNTAVREHMNALFGDERAEKLSVKLDSLSPNEKEIIIIQEITEALSETGGSYALAFRFRNNSGTRTSHHLIFVTKNVLGYNIMKDIMANQSTNNVDGVPSFQYCPVDRHQPSLFGLASPIDQLRRMLLMEFAGQKITVQELYEKHNVGKPYIMRNYQKALAQMKEQGQISTEPPKLRKNTFPVHTQVIFPD